MVGRVVVEVVLGATVVVAGGAGSPVMFVRGIENRFHPFISG